MRFSFRSLALTQPAPPLSLPTSPHATARAATPIIADDAEPAAATQPVPSTSASPARRTTPPRAAAKKPRKAAVQTVLGGGGGGGKGAGAIAAAAPAAAPKATPGTPAPYPALPAEAAHPYAHPPPRPPGHYCPLAQRLSPLPPGAYVALSWNVAGLAALLRKDPVALARLVATERADCLCLQEHKLQINGTGGLDLGLPPGWHVSWAASVAKKGYSGVAIATRHAPLSVREGVGLGEADAEGRALAVELDGFWVATVYSPNAGEGLRRLGFRVEGGGWDEALAAWVGDLSASRGGKPVILCGDLNVARDPVDIYAPDKKHEKAAGFTPEERASFAARLLGGAGLVDCLRARLPADQPAYTYWSYRAGNRPKNRGWRLDYFLAPAAFDASHILDAFQLPHVPGSDHCPVGVVVRGGAEAE